MPEQPTTPQRSGSRAIGRRSVLFAGLGGLLLPGAVLQAAESCLVTPSSTSGPYYPGVDALAPVADLTLGADGRVASGTRVVVQGLVLDGGCAPLPDAVVELWQADPQGNYDHPRARGAALMPGFRYKARVQADAQGRYRFTTLRPGRYPGRTPHLHFRVRAADGRQFTTQMYFADEPGNTRDGLWQRTRDNARVTIALQPLDALQGYPAHRADFNLVLA